VHTPGKSIARWVNCNAGFSFNRGTVCVKCASLNVQAASTLKTVEGPCKTVSPIIMYLHMKGEASGLIMSKPFVNTVKGVWQPKRQIVFQADHVLDAQSGRPELVLYFSELLRTAAT
jgi:hypothetical protein